MYNMPYDDENASPESEIVQQLLEPLTEDEQRLIRAMVASRLITHMIQQGSLRQEEEINLLEAMYRHE